MGQGIYMYMGIDHEAAVASCMAFAGEAAKDVGHDNHFVTIFLVELPTKQADP
jgi:hypothetical protein